MILRLPFSFDQSGSVHLREINNIDTVSSMNGYSPASGHESYDFITRHRCTASGKSDCHIMNAFYYNTALGFNMCRFILTVLLNICKQFFICDLFLMITGIQLLHTVDDLSFFKGTMSDRCQYRIPILKTILMHNTALVFRCQQIRRIDIFCFAVSLE